MADLFSEPFEDAPDEPVPAPKRPPARRVLSVSQLNAAVRSLIETELRDVWIEGEISNCRVWNTGHMYFTLKDGTSQLRAVMFRMPLGYLRFKPHDGLRVIARGGISVYEPKGEYQLVCEHMEPHGLGALQLAFEQLKKKLHAEGLFDGARKRPLPALPRRIGILTSLDGAALRDILKVLKRRYPNAQVLIYPARVQGDGAAADIVRGLKALSKVPDVDVIITGRGGGSVEDLWAFNEEPVARAIVAARVPVISAVGHEVDVTIADFVADMRAPAPSAAAEMVVSAHAEFCARIDRISGRLDAAARRTIASRRGAVQALVANRAFAGWPTRLALHGRHATELSHQLRRSVLSRIASAGKTVRSLDARLAAQDLRRRLAASRGRLSTLDERLHGTARRSHDRADSRFRILTGRLENLSPLAVLARGYALCWNEDRSIILRSAAEVTAGDRVRVKLHDGELDCRVSATTSPDSTS
jgi:exodeoxyribonuclease VII large subunit